MDVRLAEGMAIREALSWLKSSHQNNVIIESDAAIMVHAINKGEQFDSAFGLVISDCNFLLASLTNVKVCCIRRSANLSTDALARVAGSLHERRLWEGTLPPEICALMQEK